MENQNTSLELMKIKTNWLAEFQFSLSFLQTLNLFYLIFYAIEASTLFMLVFPESLIGLARIIASVCIGVVISSAIIVGTIYSEKEWGMHKYIFGIISLFFTLKFFHFFETYDWSMGVLSLILVTIEMNLAQIYYLKYQEEKEIKKTEEELIMISRELLAEKGKSIVWEKNTLDEKKEHTKTKEELKEVKKELKAKTLNFPCQHCGASNSSISSKKKHEAKCIHNPRNQKNTET
ncbi:hypothetical protein [Aquimarina longa]|uniref:hypothetical protein n=1 Tax=Aquimarina longa TaxID=1080221 RepID=UPI000784F089|nr:hypothetical protein [Aquimarina longa]